MSQLAVAFDRLLDALEARGSTLRSFLNPGADPDRVTAALQAGGARPHPQLIELYSWHDGTDQARIRAATDCGPQLVPATSFSPLIAVQAGWADSSSDWRYRLTSPGFSGPGPGAWPPEWYPVFPGEPDVALDTGTGEVWRYDFPWGGSNIWIAGSLAELADRIVASLESGAAQLDGYGCFTTTDI